MFACMTLLSQGGVLVSGGTQSVSSVATGTNSSTASVTFNTDGSTTGSKTGGAGGAISVHNWYTQAPAPGVGSFYWISINGGAWSPLSSSVSDSLSGTNANRTDSYSIAADAGGSNVVASGSIVLAVSNGL